MISPPLLDTRAATSPAARDNAGVVAAEQLCKLTHPSYAGFLRADEGQSVVRTSGAALHARTGTRELTWISRRSFTCLFSRRCVQLWTERLILHR
jgi:hypothetical protein